MMFSSISYDPQTQHVCLHQLVGQRDVSRKLQFVGINDICTVDVSFPALKFIPVLREREQFTRGCSANEYGKPLMVLLCMSSSVVSPREKNHTTRSGTRQNHTSALHFQGTK